MDCATCERLAGAYVDGELSAGEVAAVEDALPGCPRCVQLVEQARHLRGLLRELPVETAPPLLRARIAREVRRLPSASPWQWPRLAALAASLVLAIGAGWLTASSFIANDREQQELMAAYVRIGASDHPVDVASSDRHAVKPWFAGRIDYAPPVHDLTGEGFPLEGARIEVVDRRKVALLVYRHNQHRIALVTWPARDTSPVSVASSQRDGFAMASWRHAGFELRATSDLAPSELARFALAIERAMDADR